jgi:hypothetical protein
MAHESAANPKRPFPQSIRPSGARQIADRYLTWLNCLELELAQILAAMPQYGRDSAMNRLIKALAVAKTQSALAPEPKADSAIRPAMILLSYTAASRKDLKWRT